LILAATLVAGPVPAAAAGAAGADDASTSTNSDHDVKTPGTPAEDGPEITPAGGERTASPSSPQDANSAFGSGRQPGDPPGGGAEVVKIRESAPAVAPPSEPTAASTSGSGHDEVPATEAATVPDVSATVDASPPAIVEPSPSASPDTVASAPATAEAAQPAAPIEAPVEPAHLESVPPEPEPHVDVLPPPVAVPASPTVPATPAAAPAPASGCITVLQVMLTSATAAVLTPLTQLSSWFGAARSPWELPDSERSGSWAAAGVPARSELASLLRPRGFQAMGSTGQTDRVAPPARVGEAAFDQLAQLDDPPLPPPVLMSNATSSHKFTGLVREALDELVSSPPLMVLLWSALPGLGGLIIATGAGIRIGYRQAKFSFALRASGVARYARVGPLGVVRSGSLIAARPQTRLPRILEEAA
jgi:hypothetical protein